MAVRGNGQSNLYRREAYEFRPIKSDKKKAIEEMIDFMESLPLMMSFKDRGKLMYDRGYRKEDG